MKKTLFSPLRSALLRERSYIFMIKNVCRLFCLAKVQPHQKCRPGRPPHCPLPSLCPLLPIIASHTTGTHGSVTTSQYLLLWHRAYDNNFTYNMAAANTTVGRITSRGRIAKIGRTKKQLQISLHFFFRYLPFSCFPGTVSVPSPSPFFTLIISPSFFFSDHRVKTGEGWEVESP